MNSKQIEATNLAPEHSNKDVSNAAPLSGLLLFVKASMLALFIFFCMFAVSLVAVGIYGYNQLKNFTTQAQTTIPELQELLEQASTATPEQSNGYKTILLLGVDSVSNKPNSPELTDTMMLLSLNLHTGQIHTLSLPRDLWSSEYQTRINSLYEYGKERFPDRPEQFPEEVISELTGLPIEHTLTLSLQTVADIIDVLGGIEVTVAQGFTDSQFPREDVDLETARPEELYETVIFEPGKQHMDGKTALKYIRSRKSTDLSAGTDNARGSRQQEVIAALIERAQKFQYPQDMQTLAQLYVLYTNTFEDQLSKLEALTTLFYLQPVLSNISVHPQELGVFPQQPNGVITNPPLAKYKGQWVYEIIDPTVFQTVVQEKLERTQ